MDAAQRYTKNALLWWLHDAISHPLTGTLGLMGRILRSPRLMAIGHHIHNFTAPNNDAWADYAEASHRAGCNETDSDPFGTSTPDERQRLVDKTNREYAHEVYSVSKEVQAKIKSHEHKWDYLKHDTFTINESDEGRTWQVDKVYACMNNDDGLCPMRGLKRIKVRTFWKSYVCAEDRWYGGRGPQ